MHERPERHCYAASRLELPSRIYWQDAYPEFRAVMDGDMLHSAILSGANLIPINTTDDSRVLFAQHLSKTSRTCSAIIGPYDEVDDLWSRLAPTWGDARDVRERQYLMSLSTDASVQRDESVVFARPADLDALFPVCVEMFTSELGVSPLRDGGHSAYRTRVSELIGLNRAFVKYFNEEVVFKAEVGSVGLGVAQIQGVWLHPKYRGHGLASSALAQVVHLVRQHIAPVVSLVVNDFNEPAIRSYNNVGFRRIDTFKTILF